MQNLRVHIFQCTNKSKGVQNILVIWILYNVYDGGLRGIKNGFSN